MVGELKTRETSAGKGPLRRPRPTSGRETDVVTVDVTALTELPRPPTPTENVRVLDTKWGLRGGLPPGRSRQT